MATPTPSEFALYQKLSNPQRTDFSKPAAFKSAVHSQLGQRNRSIVRRVERVVEEDSISVTSSKSSHSHRSEKVSSPPVLEDHMYSLPQAPTPPQPTRQQQPPEYEREHYSHYEQPVPPHVDAQLHAEIEREKQGYLLELIKFKKDGHELTREYSMDDSLVDIQFEYDRIKSQIDTSSNVAFIRDCLMMSFQGIEWANRKWGPVLQLDGWSEEVCDDKEKYNRVLERLYKKHWRFGSMSPEAEFGWLIASSMLGHHLKVKTGMKIPGMKSGAGSGGGGINPMSLFSSMMGGPKRPSPSPPSAAQPDTGNSGPSRPIMSRPVMKGTPSFNISPSQPPPTSFEPPAPPPPDQSFLILQEQRKELERELQHARTEMTKMQQHMLEQQSMMQNEFAKQQYNHYKQVEALHAQLRHVERPPVGGAGTGAGAGTGPVLPRQEVENEGEGGGETEAVGRQHVAIDVNSDEESSDVSDKEVSIAGRVQPSHRLTGRRRTGLPALKLDL